MRMTLPVSSEDEKKESASLSLCLKSALSGTSDIRSSTHTKRLTFEQEKIAHLKYA